MKGAGVPRREEQSRSFRYDGLTFRVRSPHASHLAWLEDFLVPHFTPGEGGGCVVEVSLHFAPDRYCEAERAFAPPGAGGETLPAFMFDSRVEGVASREGRRGELVLLDRYFQVLFFVSPDRRRVEIVSPRNRLKVRTPLMRVLREYAMNAAQRRGDILLHASCFSAAGRAVIVAGPKSAGKTSLLMYAGMCGKAPILANDRVRVSREGTAFTLRGVPSIVSIRAGGLALFPRLAARLLATRDAFRMRQAEKDTGAPGAPVRDIERHLITPRQLANLLRTKQAGRAEHPIVVLPRITGRPGTFTLRRLGAPQSGRALQDSLFGSRHWAKTTPVFNAREEEPADARVAAQNRRLFVKSTPFFVCEMGTDLYRSEANYTELVRTLISLADERGAPDRTPCRCTTRRAAPPGGK